MMTLIAIRAAVLPQRAAVRMALLSLVGAVAVIAGLLAMHTMSVEPASHASAVASAPTGRHAVDADLADSDPVPAGDCASGDCAPVHASGLSACVLALLVATIIFLAVPLRSRWLTLIRAQATSLALSVRAIEAPPPSLFALSISRT
jgi:hypothetical protein